METTMIKSYLPKLFNREVIVKQDSEHFSLLWIQFLSFDDVLEN